MIYDFELAWDTDELKKILRVITQSGWTLVSVTQDEGLYTVFFGRPRG